MLKLGEFAILLATGANIAYFATVGADWAPQVTPIWIDYEDGYLLVNAALRTLTDRNVRREPRGAVLITEHDNPYTKVDIRAEVDEFIEERELRNRSIGSPSASSGWIGIRLPFRPGSEQQ